MWSMCALGRWTLLLEDRLNRGIIFSWIYWEVATVWDWCEETNIVVVEDYCPKDCNQTFHCLWFYQSQESIVAITGSRKRCLIRKLVLGMVDDKVEVVPIIKNHKFVALQIPWARPENFMVIYILQIGLLVWHWSEVM